MCCQISIRVDHKILSSRREPMPSGFLTQVNLEENLTSYHGSVAEHWWLKPEMSMFDSWHCWSFHFPSFFSLANYLYFQHKAGCSEHVPRIGLYLTVTNFMFLTFLPLVIADFSSSSTQYTRSSTTLSPSLKT